MRTPYPLLPRRVPVARRISCRLAFLALVLVVIAPSAFAEPGAKAEPPVRDEIFYHIFVRSFHDSNGDGHGDLKGIEQKLDYLHELGVTTLLLTPLYASPFYHSYFPDDFGRVDPAYGTAADLRHLVAALHRRRMQIFLDQEIQYITASHPWYRESFEHPGSPFSRFLMYRGPGNTKPESGPWGITELLSYSGKTYRVFTVNLHEPALRAYQAGLFRDLALPTGPGADDGVDGFRIDHMEDNLDGRGILPDLFVRFWTPLFEQVRADAPRIRILAEQADWTSYGEDWLVRGHADLVFAFRLRDAIAAFDKTRLAEAMTETWRRTPAGKGQIVFIENHDLNRFASEVGGDPRKEKVGAALNLLVKGIPSIYYGQEIGMQGRKATAWKSDANDIPVREAFPWTPRTTPGVAAWYKDTGPWWDQSALARGTAPSLEREESDPDSLLSFYKRLIALRGQHPALIAGEQTLVANDRDTVLTFTRTRGTDRLLAAVSLVDQPVTVHVTPAAGSVPEPKRDWRQVLGGLAASKRGESGLQIELPAYGVAVFEAGTLSPEE